MTGFTTAEAPKTFFDGTHRIRDPEATLRQAAPLAERMGITRVAVLTGLDVIGIPVAAAMRPNSRSIAVHQGKGGTVAAAKASAVMEGVEAFHAETIALPLRLASHAEMSAAAEAADPADLPRARGREAGDERFLWLEGQDLFNGRPLWVPHELVSADFTVPLAPGAGLFAQTTNGLASGNHWLEAATHALYEVVERDAIALWRAATDAAQDRCALDLATVDDESGRAMLACFAGAGVAVQVWDITTDIQLPCFLCLCSSAGLRDGVEPQFGSGCHADRVVALTRALSEAAQARLTVISGARDDVGAAGYRPAERARRERAAGQWLRVRGRRDFRNAPSGATKTLGGDLDFLLGRLASAGLRQAAWVDLTKPEIGIAVGRAIVPGLEGLWTPSGGEYTPGVRARAEYTPGVRASAEYTSGVRASAQRSAA